MATVIRYTYRIRRHGPTPGWDRVVRLAGMPPGDSPGWGPWEERTGLAVDLKSRPVEAPRVGPRPDLRKVLGKGRRR